jgi:hypothetical protein
MIRLIFLATVASALAGCASAPRQQCEPATEATPVDGKPVYRACAVDRTARLTTTRATRSSWTPSPPYKVCYTALIEVVVSDKGIPLMETVNIVRHNDASFAEAARGEVAAAIYQPALKDGLRVQQRVQIPRSAQTRSAISCTP